MSFAAKLLISVGCVFGLLAAYTAAATWRIETQYPPIGDFVTVQGVRIHYVDSGAGPAVVLLHGASSSLRDFEASILPELARDSRVIAIDRPGYGYSERPTENWPDPTTQANLIHQALLALGVEQPILVGHSWSGSIVLSYLLDHPDHAGGGVLLAGAANAWEGGVSWFVNVAGWPIIGWVFSATVALPLGQLVLNSAIRGAFAPEQPTPGYRSRTAAVLALRPSAFRASTEDVRKLSDFLRQQWSRYDEIKSPLLLITGENDTIVPAWNHANVLASRLPHAHRVDLPGAGHALHHTRRKDVVRLIHAFLRKRL